MYGPPEIYEEDGLREDPFYGDHVAADWVEAWDRAKEYRKELVALRKELGLANNTPHTIVRDRLLELGMIQEK